MLSSLPPKSNRFFHGQRATFPPNFWKMSRVVLCNSVKKTNKCQWKDNLLDKGNNNITVSGLKLLVGRQEEHLVIRKLKSYYHSSDVTGALHIFHFWLSALPPPSSPSAGSGVVRIDPLRFLVRCCKRWLNHALYVLSLSLGFFCCMCVVLLTRDSF